MHTHIVAAFQFGAAQIDLRRSPAPPERFEQGTSIIVCTYKRADSLNRFIESLAKQPLRPKRFVVVDASPDDSSEKVVRSHPAIGKAANHVIYFRVSGPLKGLTRQRNFGLQWIETDLVAFFDDDIVLLDDCLTEMESVHRAYGSYVAGVGAYINDAFKNPPLLWRLRHWVGIVPDLQPGRYHRCGMSVPWDFLPPSDQIVEGDSLPGCAMMWKTQPAQKECFFDRFSGYSQGEDLEFSLRMQKYGKLVISGRARLLHLHDASGRPDHFKKGYMAILNRYQIHQRNLKDRGWTDVAWFIYAWTFDTLLLARRLVKPRYIKPTLNEWAGRLRACWDLVFHSRQLAGN